MRANIIDGKSTPQWARELGVPIYEIRRRKKTWGTVHADEIVAIKEARREAKAKPLEAKRKAKAEARQAKIEAKAKAIAERKERMEAKRFEGKTLAEWGRELGVTREMIRQRMNRWGTVHTDQIATIKEAKRKLNANNA